ncbi:hypothetical protein Taro_009144 [Colocasia esculenta]|uniref:Uncharacterized protein n=1 Tax=Colocasia esculenta TaxID=4460 RepID=A0A843TZJ0_COLES|nr:hypothetical protein [Colocasia esculenta]
MPEIELGQFRGAIDLLKVESPVNCSFKVDFAIMQIPEIVFLPKLHSLVMDSSVGPIIFERFSKVMGRMSAQQDRYDRFLDEQRALHIKLMVSDMGPSYSIAIL